MELLEKAIVEKNLFVVKSLFESKEYSVSEDGEIEVKGKNIGKLRYNRIGDVEEDIMTYLLSKHYEAGFIRGIKKFNMEQREKEARKVNIL